MSKNREIAIQCLLDEAKAIEELTTHIDEDLDHAVETILRCKGKLIVTGVGKSGHIGAKIAATLSSTGTPSFFVNPLDVFHGDLGVIGKDDVVLAISNSGQTDELLRFMSYLLSNHIPVIAMTGNANSLLAKNANYHLYTGVNHEACPLNLAPTSSTTATLAMGDALVTMSNGRLGLLIAVKDGKVEGVVTDGDVRRAMERHHTKFFSSTVAENMTRHPKCVSPDTKVVEIDEMMHNNKIHCVLVTDEQQRLIGVIDSFKVGAVK